MKRFLTLAAVAVLVLGASSAVFANVCSLDQTPSATLLFPFVTYDYNGGSQGETTLFAVTNVSDSVEIVHFVLWTDYSFHVIDWNVVLSGYDVVTMNIRDILVNGDLPNTGIEYPGNFAAPNDIKKSTVVGGGVTEDGPVISPNTWDVMPDPVGTMYGDFIDSRCPTDGRYYPDYPPIPSGILSRMKTFLLASQTTVRGEVSCSTGDFYDFSDYWFTGRTTADPTWMYITADVVWTCNGLFPDSSANYWTAANQTVAPSNADSGAQAMFDNVLIGDIFYVDPAKRLSEAMPAVHLEADQDLGAVTTPNFADGEPQSFYHQYVMANGAGYTATYGDYREPLPTAWGFRWLNSADMSTSVRVYKRASAELLYLSQSPGMVTDMLFLDSSTALWGGSLAEDPPAYMFAWDCQAYTYYAWDEDENPTTSVGGGTGPSCPPNTPECTPVRINLLPLETQEVNINQFRLPSADSGWMLLIFPWSNTPNDDIFQTYVSVRYAAYGNYSAATQAAVMANYSCFPEQIVPALGINYDYVTPLGYWNPNAAE